MSILSDLNEALLPLGIPVETGVFSDTPPDEYLVFTPLTDIYLNCMPTTAPGMMYRKSGFLCFQKEIIPREKSRLQQPCSMLILP